MLNSYVQAAGIDLSSNLKFFRTLHFVRSEASYTLRSTGISYTRAREIVLDAFSQLGFPAKLFGLHSLRSGGATAAANAGVNDRLFKRHGRWRSDKLRMVMLRKKRCFQSPKVWNFSFSFLYSLSLFRLLGLIV